MITETELIIITVSKIRPTEYNSLIRVAYGHQNYKLTVIAPDKSYLVQITATKNGSQEGYQRATISIAYRMYKQCR